jgi:hypothetical protein
MLQELVGEGRIGGREGLMSDEGCRELPEICRNGWKREYAVIYHEVTEIRKMG